MKAKVHSQRPKYTGRKWGSGGLPPEKVYWGHLLQRRKMPLVEQNVGALIIDLRDKMENLFPSFVHRNL